MFDTGKNNYPTLELNKKHGEIGYMDFFSLRNLYRMLFLKLVNLIKKGIFAYFLFLM